jgi:hypothetical protein
MPPQDCQFHVQVLRMPDTEEIISQIEFRVNPQVCLTQRHEGSYMQDPRGGSGCVVLGCSIAATSGGTSAMVYRIPAHKMP